MNILEETCLENLTKKRNDLLGFDPENEEECLEVVKESGIALRFVHKQTPEICLTAVKDVGTALRYVLNKTPDICLEAVKQNGLALEYVDEQTPEICLAAVNQDAFSLRYVKNQTPELCLAAVNKDERTLTDVRDLNMLCKEKQLYNYNKDTINIPSAKEAFEISTNISTERNNKALSLVTNYIIDSINKSIYNGDTSISICRSDINDLGADALHSFIGEKGYLSCKDNIIPKLEELGYKCDCENINKTRLAVLNISWKE